MWLWTLLTTIPRPDERPTKLADLGFRVGTHVAVPFLDARTCDGVQLRMDKSDDFKAVQALFDYGELDPATADMPERDRTLQIALKCYYRDLPLFHGPVSVPAFDYGTGLIEVAGRDPSLRLEHAFLNATDEAVTNGVTLDGEGIFSILASGQNTDAQDALDWPSLGIIPGKDTSTASDTLHKSARGDQIWQTLKDIADLEVGPDWELEPIETDPAELASGDITWSTGAVIGDGLTTDITFHVSNAGDIGGLRLDIYAEHANPPDIDIDLIHPDGTTVRVYTGSKDKPASATDFLGTGTASGQLARFSPATYNSIYGDDEAYPHVGNFRSDHSLARFYDKPAAGDWTLRFIDTATNSHSGFLDYFALAFLLPAPAYCRLNVFDKPATDDPDNPIVPSCTFYKGHGKDNARILVVRPQGDLVKNEFVATSKSSTKVRVNDVSRAEIGTYQGWDSPGENASIEVLTAYADAEVAAYNRPVPAVDLAPIDDSGTNDTPRLGVDFTVGGHVRAIAKRGRAGHDVTVRVTHGEVLQKDSAVETTMEVLATVGAPGEIGDG